VFTVLTAVDADNTSLAAWAQTAFPVCVLFYQTTDVKSLNNDPTGIFGTIKAAKYNRCFGIYATTQNNTAPGNLYAACAAMGVVMGRNTGLSSSYFIVSFKNVVGVVPEPVTQPQFMSITGLNGNAYVNFANTYNSLMNGNVGDGEYFDQILGLDMLVSDLRYALTNILYVYPAIPQTDQGQSVLLHGANGACQRSVDRGFLGDGVWQGQPILALQPGMTVPGYRNQSPTYASLGQKPANRQAAPIYCAVILAEAVQSILIAVYVQQ
jgi:hypothetical protein